MKEIELSMFGTLYRLSLGFEVWLELWLQIFCFFISKNVRCFFYWSIKWSQDEKKIVEHGKMSILSFLKVKIGLVVIFLFSTLLSMKFILLNRHFNLIIKSLSITSLLHGLTPKMCNNEVDLLM